MTRACASPRRPRLSPPAVWNLLPGRGGEQLLVQRREARSDPRPAVSAALCVSASATSPAFLLAVRGREERVDERVLVVGGNQPAGLSVNDDRRRAMRAGGDYR